MIQLKDRDTILTLFDKYKNFLTQTQKQIMHLYFVEDLSLAEVANIIATTRSAVYDAIKKGKKKLKLIDSKINS